MARVDKLFAQWNRADSPGCILGVSQNGSLTYERGYGMANLDHGLPITLASRFPLGSISKQFTAMAILMLAQRGQLSLDDDVRKYITELPDYESRITLRHLLTHTSGLRNGFQLLRLDGWRDDDVQTTDDVVKLLARQRVHNSRPGVEYRYNNSGYTLLAVIVERVSGLTLRAFADSNIFQPLGMTTTHFHDDPSMIVPNRASGYYVGARGDGRGFPGNVMSDADLQDLHVGNHADLVGAGGIYSTVRDLLLWERNFDAVRVGTPALVALMQTPTLLTGGDTSSYGLGLQIGQYRGLREIGHGGSDVGWDLRVVRYPDQGLAVTVLCNLENIHSSMLARGVVDIYLADLFPAAAATSAPAPPITVSLSAEQLASKEGLYRDTLSGLLRRVFARDGKLREKPHVGPGAGSALTPLSVNRFLVVGPGVTWEFVPAAAGRAQEIHEFAEGRREPRVFQQVNPFAPSSTELRAFAGEYVSPELETTYTVVARDSVLVLQPSRGTNYVLRPTFTDAFEDENTGLRFTRSSGIMFDFGLRVGFTRDAQGVVSGLLVNTSQVRNLRFDRVKR